jgi:hypothetical protein
MHDNKVRLSQDVLEKAEQIANEWGLKNARAAVEAVFRKYCDDYHYGRIAAAPRQTPLTVMSPTSMYESSSPQPKPQPVGQDSASPPPCEALDALDRLLAL